MGTEMLSHPVDLSLRIPLRPTHQVMKLSNLGAYHQTRLSFMRSLLRRLQKEKWQVCREIWQINSKGYGHAVYQAEAPSGVYSLVCFSNYLSPEQRSDRVIAEAWDATYALFNGIPTDDDIEYLSKNVPKQEAGRCSGRESALSRSNKSVRLFSYVVDCLAQGEQPERQKIEAVGYLMRTTAVYGNGKFGLADFSNLAGSDFSNPFYAELLSVWLIRQFTVDLVEHIAHARSPETAVLLKPEIRTLFGVGNSTGLGMAPFLIHHSALLHQWVFQREKALQTVRKTSLHDAQTKDLFLQYIGRASEQAHQWGSVDATQKEKIEVLRDDVKKLETFAQTGVLECPFPWNLIYEWAEQKLSHEGRELCVSLLLEVHGDLIDELSQHMGIDENNFFEIDGSSSVADLCLSIDNHYGWAMNFDFQKKSEQSRFWYISEEKLEPRLGERFEEKGSEREQPLAIARDLQGLRAQLKQTMPEQSIGDFLSIHPQYRHIIRRIGIREKMPYSEIEENLISSQLLPLDILRCKLSFFGASRFDPRSDRWLRVCLYQNAPFMDELEQAPFDDWGYPSSENFWRQKVSPRHFPQRIEKNKQSRSLNEWALLSTKAFRGAGMSWGLAEEVGKAFSQLAKYGFRFPNGVALLKMTENIFQNNLNHIPKKKNGRWEGSEGMLQPIIFGVFLQDNFFSFSEGTIDLSETFAPIFLLPFIQNIVCRQKKTIGLRWHKTEVMVSPNGFVVSDQRELYALQADEVHIFVSSTPVSSAPRRSFFGPIVLDTELLTCFENSAARLYVPSAGTSRSSGAGAGLTDND